MIDIGVAYYRIKAVNEIDAIWYTSRQDNEVSYYLYLENIVGKLFLKM